MKLKGLETKKVKTGLKITFKYNDLSGVTHKKSFITHKYFKYVTPKLLTEKEYKEKIKQYKYPYSWVCDCDIIQTVNNPWCHKCKLRMKMRHASDNGFHRNEML